MEEMKVMMVGENECKCFVLFFKFTIVPERRQDLRQRLYDGSYDVMYIYGHRFCFLVPHEIKVNSPGVDD